MVQTDNGAAVIFAALGNSYRIAIVRQLLRKGISCADADSCDLSEKCCDVGELARVVSIAPSTLSYHLKELRGAGIIFVHRQGQHLFYEANRESIDTAVSTILESVVTDNQGKR